MSQTLQFELVSPEQLLMDAPATMVEVPGSEGDFGVLPGHAPMMSTIRPGLVTVYGDTGDPRSFFLKGGFAEVTATGLVILAEETIDPQTVDKQALSADIDKAREAVSAATGEAERAHAARQLAWREALYAIA